MFNSNIYLISYYFVFSVLLLVQFPCTQQVCLFFFTNYNESTYLIIPLLVVNNYYLYVHVINVSAGVRF